MTLEEYVNLKIEVYQNSLKRVKSLSSTVMGKKLMVAKDEEVLKVLHEIKEITQKGE